MDENVSGVLDQTAPQLPEMPVAPVADTSNDANVIGSDAFIQRVKETISQTEAPRKNGEIDYTGMNAYGYMGKYQFGKSRLADLGWQGKANEFLNNKDLQEEMMTKSMQDYVNRMRKDGIITDKTTAAEVAGKLAFAHISGYGGMRSGSQAKDANGVSGSMYEKIHSQGFMDPTGAQKNLRAELDRNKNGYDVGQYEAIARSKVAEPVTSNVLKESFLSGKSTAYDQTVAGLNETMASSQAEVAKQIEALTGKPFQVDPRSEDNFVEKALAFIPSSPISDIFGGESEVDDAKYGRAFDKQLQALKSENPSLKLPVNSYAELKLKAFEKIEYNQQQAEAANPQSTFSGGLASVAGSIIGVMSDPRELVKNFIPLPGMAGAGIATKAAAGFAAGAVTEVGTQISVQSRRKDMGDTQAGLAQGAANVAMVGGAVGTFSVVGDLIGKVVKAFGGQSITESLSNATKQGLEGLGLWAKKAEQAAAELPEGNALRNTLQDAADDILNTESVVSRASEVSPTGTALSPDEVDSILTRTELSLAEGKAVSDVLPVQSKLATLETTIPEPVLREDVQLGKAVKGMNEFSDALQSGKIASEGETAVKVGGKEGVKPYVEVSRAMEAQAEQLRSDPFKLIDESRFEVEKYIKETQDAAGPSLDGTSVRAKDVELTWVDEDGLETTLNLRKHQEEVQKEVGVLKQFQDCILKNGG